jgi:ADP-heptose:LPS heptosyltransferase
VKVLDALLGSGVGKVIITSGGQDWQVEHAGRIAEGAGERAVFLGGRTRIEEFLWLVAHARMVLGVDGAASHLAAAFGGKSLTLFFRTNPHNWHLPTGRSVALLASRDEESDTYDFEIDEVAGPACALWAR